MQKKFTSHWYSALLFPAVSHSPEYRQTYKPAYRIILRRKE